jgi:hypothetical protein
VCVGSALDMVCFMRCALSVAFWLVHAMMSCSATEISVACSILHAERSIVSVVRCMPRIACCVLSIARLRVMVRVALYFVLVARCVLHVAGCRLHVHGVCCTAHILNAPPACYNRWHAIQCTGTVLPVHVCCMCVLRVACYGIYCTLHDAAYDAQYNTRMLHSRHAIAAHRHCAGCRPPAPSQAQPLALRMPLGCSYGAERARTPAAQHDRCALAAGEYSQYPCHGRWTVAVGEYSQYPAGGYSEYPACPTYGCVGG